MARDERRAHLAEAYRADELLQERIANVDRQVEIVMHESRAAIAPGHIDLDRVVEAQRFELSMRSQQRQLQQQRQAIGEEIERRREALMEANRQVRVLEQLRERQAERYRQEEALKEIKQLDEMASVRVARGGEDDTP
jgi:flagellar export protein FliJ